MVSHAFAKATTDGAGCGAARTSDPIVEPANNSNPSTALRIAPSYGVPMRVLLLLTLFALCACTTPVVDGQGPFVSLDVKGRAQRRNLSCESRSACDLLAHYGIQVDEETFFARLPKSDNPDYGFVGDVNGPTGQLPPQGYGVHEQPIATTLTSFGLEATAFRRPEMTDLHAHIWSNRPVIVWATSTLRPGTPVTLRDGAGREFQAVRGEHTYIAVGWDAVRGRIELLDAATGKRKLVSLERFEAAWDSLGNRAVVPIVYDR